jgi:hypothetical protein
MKETDFNSILKASRLFGDRHWCRTWFNELCIFDHKFVAHVSDQEAGYQHYLCLVKIGFERLQKGYAPQQQVLMIRKQTRKWVIEKLYGHYPSGLMKVLSKLGNSVITRASYVKLISVLGDDDSKKSLQHSRRVYPASLEIIGQLPNAIRHCPIVMKLRTKQESSAFLFMIRSVIRIRSDLSSGQLARSLSRVKDKNDLNPWYIAKLEKGVFPAAPWKGNDKATPLDTRKKLIRTGAEMGNCLGDNCPDVVLGKSYFYSGLIDSTAYVLELQADVYVGWVINEILGPQNEELTSRDVEKITDVFREVGFDFETMGSTDYTQIGWH